MELKKKEFADLDKKRGLYLLTGFIFTLLFVILAFQWKTYDTQLANLGVLETKFEETIEIPPTKQELPPPPPPQLKQPDIVEVKNDEIIQETKIDFNTEIIEDAKVEVRVPEKEEAPPPEILPEIFLVVEEPQSFPGGNDGIAKFLKTNIRYPEVAKNAGIEGRVFVQFVVNEGGNVDQVQILKGIGGGCDEEAARVVKLMKWNPGKQRGKPVKVRMSLPIKFTLG